MKCKLRIIVSGSAKSLSQWSTVALTRTGTHELLEPAAAAAKPPLTLAGLG